LLKIRFRNISYIFRSGHTPWPLSQVWISEMISRKQTLKASIFAFFFLRTAIDETK